MHSAHLCSVNCVYCGQILHLLYSFCFIKFVYSIIFHLFFYFFFGTAPICVQLMGRECSIVVDRLNYFHYFRINTCLPLTFSAPLFSFFAVLNFLRLSIWFQFVSLELGICVHSTQISDLVAETSKRSFL